MENTALNGSTNATTVTKNQEWKTKKGYGPIIVAVSLALLLGLSFYAGRHSAAMRMTNGVGSSSSSAESVVVATDKFEAIRDCNCADFCHTKKPEMCRRRCRC